MPRIFNAGIDLGVGTVINWRQGNVFYNNISASKSFTFSNTFVGGTVMLIIRNTGVSTITITLPTIVKNNDFDATVMPGRQNVITFVNNAGTIYATSSLDMM